MGGEDDKGQGDHENRREKVIQCDGRGRIVLLTVSSNFTKLAASPYIGIRPGVDHMERAVGQVEASEAARPLLEWGEGRQNTTK